MQGHKSCSNCYGTFLSDGQNILFATVHSSPTDTSRLEIYLESDKNTKRKVASSSWQTRCETFRALYRSMEYPITKLRERERVIAVFSCISNKHFLFIRSRYGANITERIYLPGIAGSSTPRAIWYLCIYGKWYLDVNWHKTLRGNVSVLCLGNANFGKQRRTGNWCVVVVTWLVVKGVCFFSYNVLFSVCRKWTIYPCLWISSSW